jgi:hypothetical protein
MSSTIRDVASVEPVKASSTALPYHRKALRFLKNADIHAQRAAEHRAKAKAEQALANHLIKAANLACPLVVRIGSNET